MEALVRASRCKDDDSKQQCLDQLPLGVLQLRPRNMKKKGPANSAAKKRQKSIWESLKRARQTVSWSGVTMKYEAEFVVRKNLEASRGHEAAENMWNNWCFSLAVLEHSAGSALSVLRRACMSMQGRTIGSPRTMRLFLENLLKETDGVDAEEREITALKEKLRNADASKIWFRNTRQHELLLNSLKDSGIKFSIKGQE